MQNSELTGILWHQGESDSLNGHYKDYYNKLHSIIEALRKELHAPDVPLIIGGLGDFLGAEGFGKHCTEYPLINKELQRFALNEANCYFVTASGLTSNPDGIHMDAISQRKFGLRYFEAFHNKQHVWKPLMNEEERVNHTHERTHTKTEKMYIKSMELVSGKISYDAFESEVTQMNKG